MFNLEINRWLNFNQPCSLCHTRKDVHQGLCESCRADLPWLIQACPRCALPLQGIATANGCPDCLKLRPVYDRTLAAFRYDFPLSQILPAIKYHRQPQAIGWLGAALADFLPLHYEDQHWPEALVPVPMHLLSESARGFNQAQLLAKVLSTHLQIPLWQELHKHRRTPHQADLDLKQRRQNLHSAFCVKTTPPAHVALVDDVMTTGTTVNTLAGLLKEAGCERVEVWVLARTPEVR